jgi:hypothetical protein
MTIPVGRHRLVLSLVTAPRREALDVPAALDATDAELARLAGRQPVDVERAQWEAMALLYGPQLH